MCETSWLWSFPSPCLCPLRCISTVLEDVGGSQDTDGRQGHRGEGQDVYVQTWCCRFHNWWCVWNAMNQTLPSQCRTKTCSWCKGIQGVEDTRRCIWVWFYPGFYHRKYTVFSCVLVVLNLYAVLLTNIYFTVKNRKLIMSGNFKCLYLAIMSAFQSLHLSVVPNPGVMTSCGDTKGFLEVAKSFNYWNIKIYLLNSQIWGIASIYVTTKNKPLLNYVACKIFI